MTITDADTQPPESLHELLDAMRPRDGDSRVTVQDVLTRIGARSFPAVLLVPTLLLVSPVSGIPGTPTLGAILVLMIALQGLFGRNHLWLPDFLMRRSISAGRMDRAINWLKGPAGWFDRHSRNRLRLLTSGPLRWLAYLTTALVALSWPLLELLPFVTSFGAGSIALLMFGMMTRDGAYTVAGYACGAALYLTLLTLWTGLI